MYHMYFYSYIGCRIYNVFYVCMYFICSDQVFIIRIANVAELFSHKLAASCHGRQLSVSISAFNIIGKSSYPHIWASLEWRHSFPCSSSNRATPPEVFSCYRLCPVCSFIMNTDSYPNGLLLPIMSWVQLNCLQISVSAQLCTNGKLQSLQLVSMALSS